MQETHAITGAFGFSGKYLARRLLQAGHKVITLTNSPQRSHSFAATIPAYPFDFDHPQRMAEHLQGVDVLYNTYWVRFNHEGPQQESFTHARAVAHTLALYEAAKLAGVKRFVHVSITNADATSPFEYFQGKGELEAALQASGLSYAIVRPAVLFGSEGILINNIAWMLRHFPFFGMFGDGSYRLQPIFVDDLAQLMQEQGAHRENSIVEALGPEDFTYLELVRMIRRTLGVWTPIIGMPPMAGYWVGALLGKVLHDVVVTKPEVEALMADTLHVPGAIACGTTRLSTWVRSNRETLGKHYASELVRRKNRLLDYEAFMQST